MIPTLKHRTKPWWILRIPGFVFPSFFQDMPNYKLAATTTALWSLFNSDVNSCLALHYEDQIFQKCVIILIFRKKIKSCLFLSSQKLLGAHAPLVWFFPSSRNTLDCSSAWTIFNHTFSQEYICKLIILESTSLVRFMIPSQGRMLSFQEERAIAPYLAVSSLKFLYSSCGK